MFVCVRVSMSVCSVAVTDRRYKAFDLDSLTNTQRGMSA